MKFIFNEIFSNQKNYSIYYKNYKTKNLLKKTIYWLNKPENIVKDFVENNFNNLLFSLHFVLDLKKRDMF